MLEQARKIKCIFSDFLIDKVNLITNHCVKSAVKSHRQLFNYSNRMHVSILIMNFRICLTSSIYRQHF